MFKVITIDETKTKRKTIVLVGLVTK